MKSITFHLLSGLVVAGIGLAVGIVVQSGQGPAAGADDAHAEGPPTFSKQSLANLGVSLGRARLGSFTEYRVLQAVVQDAPLNDRRVTAPLPGTVAALPVAPGVSVAGGVPVATMIRDAIPRPTLEFTKDVFTPVSESMHEALAALRLAVGELAVLEKEIARIDELNRQAAGEVPLVGGQARIQLGYDRERAQARLANARIELEHHGLSEAEIEKLESGGHAPRGYSLWRRVLEVHGLWSDHIQRIHQALPAADRDLPWTIAVLGELSSTGLATKALADAIAAERALQTNFVDVAGLLLAGEPLPRVMWLAERGALGSRFDMRAPADATWDVERVLVRVGDHVERGQPLLVLHDPSTMWLRVLPVGDEVPVVLAAVRDATAVAAHPLLADVGPVFTGLRIARVASGAAGRDVAYIPVPNSRLDAGEGRVRSWQLRAGMRYDIRVPHRTHEGVFVLDKDAVTKEGVDRVVYLRNGESFAAKAVRVLFENDVTVVVANDGSLFVDDLFVTKGAFAIGLAMQQSAGGGHGHSHDH